MSRKHLRSILAWVVTALLVAAPACAEEDYPSAAGVGAPELLNIRFTYPGISGWGGSREDGYFRLGTGSARVVVDDRNPPACADLHSETVVYPLAVSESNDLVASVPKIVRDQFTIVVRLVQSPRWQAPALPAAAPHSSDSNHPFVVLRKTGLVSPRLPADASCNIIRPGCTAQWLDSEVTIRIEVWGPPTTNDPLQPFVHEKTLRTRMIAQCAEALPHLFPVAIVGQPPGNSSWSRLTATSGAAVNAAVTEQDASSLTASQACSLGPIPLADDGIVTECRRERKGVWTSIQASQVYGLQTEGAAYGPGTGDTMIALRRASFRLYLTPQDLDFRFASAPTEVVVFPMRALETPGCNPRVDLLTAAERRALAALNPLLADPHANLAEPRYYLVQRLNLRRTTTAGGATVRTIGRTEVERIVGNSASRDSDATCTISMGAIVLTASELSALLPDAARPEFDNSATDVQIKTDHSFDDASGILCEYVIGDSDSTKEFPVEVYYDTYFRTFLFRDNSTLRLTKLRDSLGSSKWSTTFKSAKILVDDDAAQAGLFHVYGALKEAPGKDHTLELTPEKSDSTLPVHRSTIVAGTYNILIPSMQPGTYKATLGGNAYRLILEANGEVSFKKTP